MVFKLVEERKLNLDDKVTNYIKLKNPIIGIENITIKNLLNHTSGLHYYTKNPDWMKNLMSNNAPETFNEKLLLIENKLNNKGNFTNSNTNYLFLEKIVESVTKKPFQEVFNKFYSKIELPNIKIGVNEEGLEAYFGQTEKGSSKVSAWREYYGFDGGVYTNTKTLDTFLTKLYKDISILKPSTIAQMET